jgi:hypothetical protein
MATSDPQLMTTPPTRLAAPIGLAIVVGLGDLAEAAIGFSAWRTGHRDPVASWASLYLFGAEAATGAVILLLAAIAAGRSTRAARTAVGLAWVRLITVTVTATLIMFPTVTTRDPGSSTLPVVLAAADALLGLLICATIARRTRHITTPTRPRP